MMSYTEKREQYRDVFIDLSEGTLTEMLWNGPCVYRINEILDRWDGVPGVTLTIEQRSFLSPSNKEVC